jgi:hypothetical protein
VSYWAGRTKQKDGFGVGGGKLGGITGTRGKLQHLVNAGFMTTADADEVAELIDAVTEYVELGALSREDGDLLIDQMAQEKAASYHERQLFG